MLTTIIKTKNSEDTISETLESVKDLGSIVLLDEHSGDDTVLIAKEYKAKIIYTTPLDFIQAFSGTVGGIESDWILFLEGDEVIPDTLGQKILDYIEKPKKNKDVLYLAQKLFYLDKEIKADRKFCLKVFKKGSAEFLNNYSSFLKPVKTKGYKLNFGFKQDKNCVLKFEKRNIFDVLNNTVQKNIVKSKEANRKSASVFIKPLFKFLYFYFLKKAVLEGRKGFIYSALKAFDCFLFECFKYENKDDYISD